jgi:hypothetical protein
MTVGNGDGAAALLSAGMIAHADRAVVLAGGEFEHRFSIVPLSAVSVVITGDAEQAAELRARGVAVRVASRA